MIILDTNILSETMRPVPNAQVIDWLNAQPRDSLFITNITLAELGFGIQVLPDGKRKTALEGFLTGLRALFAGRVLSFDAEAAEAYAHLAAKARTAGIGLPMADGYIAAIAHAQGFKVATRDTAPFQAAGMLVVNPFEMPCR
jgi:predicted nucleic acid-binding protein